MRYEVSLWSRSLMLTAASLLVLACSAEAQRRPHRSAPSADNEPASVPADVNTNTGEELNTDEESNPFAPGPPATAADVFGDETAAAVSDAIPRLKSRVTASWPMVAVPEREEERRLVSSLEQSGDFVFYDVPLEEALHYLQEVFEVRFLLDDKSMEQAGVDRHAEVTLEREGLSLRTGLTHLLDSLELTFIVREDAIHITTHACAAAKPARRVYDLSQHKQGEGSHAEQLVLALDEALAQEGITLVLLGNQLIVVADEQGHYEVARLLTLLHAGE